MNDAPIAADAGVEQPVVEVAEEFAIVEIMGHRRHVGRILEVERFGGKFLRIDVPTDGDFEKGWVSHLYAMGAIFGVTFTTADEVRRANAPYERRALGHYREPPEEETDDGSTSPDDFGVKFP